MGDKRIVLFSPNHGKWVGTEAEYELEKEALEAQGFTLEEPPDPEDFPEDLEE